MFRSESPDRFEVEEIPAYEPVGDGEHAFLWIEKRGLTTREAIERVARALGADAREAGWAGLKDRVAVARQWISLRGVDPVRARELALPGVRVLRAGLHPHRLRTGHLRGNRFVVTVRARDDLETRLRDLAARGLPNRYGEQRFGRDNVGRGRALLRGEAAARGREDRRMIVSALQAHAFNAVLAERRGRGWLERVEGDLCGGEAPTGPMPGWRMPRPAQGSRARLIEDEVLAREGALPESFRPLGRLGRGARRPLVVPVEDASVETDGEWARVRFRLPRGSYASVLMEEIGCASP